ncbi:MAG: MinD/ParA family protein [Pseudomonadota bacterium]|nr:cobyrinic acid a,c-diamide synthase [Pseudomonadales bacterium]MDY6919468.1 MinD/ParA family protein [Pseudomonadota bacterium]
MNNHPVQVIAITGGKGGVGKSNVSINLGVSLAEMGRRVVLLDADLGLANLDILLGISAQENLSHVLKGECGIRDILVEGPAGIKIVPASSGTQELVNMGPREHAGLIHAFSELSEDIDVLLVDTAAGISEMVMSFVTAAQESLFVVTNEPTSITDAYAMMKILNQKHGLYRFNVVANMVRTQQEGREIYNKLTKVTDRFLDVALQFSGCIPMDDCVRKAVMRQKPVVEAYPRSKAALAFRTLANKVDSWPLPSNPRGHLEFFVDRLVQGAVAR